MNKDSTSTIAGGVAGFAMLQSVRWELVGVQVGETVKVGVALGLALVGYLMYRGKEPTANA